MTAIADAKSWLDNLERLAERGDNVSQFGAAASIIRDLLRIAAPPAPSVEVLIAKFAESLRRYWSFDDRQRHTHTWHNREDFIAEVLPNLIAPNLSSECWSEAVEAAAEFATCFADKCDATAFSTTVADQVSALRSKEQAANEIAQGIRSLHRGAKESDGGVEGHAGFNNGRSSRASHLSRELEEAGIKPGPSDPTQETVTR
ncbi:MAG: hypothetical protein J0G33_02885 [Afipia felis]|nr:hypothetical protein [Afipia felis]